MVSADYLVEKRISFPPSSGSAVLLAVNEDDDENGC